MFHLKIYSQISPILQRTHFLPLSFYMDYFSTTFHTSIQAWQFIRKQTLYGLTTTAAGTFVPLRTSQGNTPPRDLSYTEPTLHCGVTHGSLRELSPLGTYPYATYPKPFISMDLAEEHPVRTYPYGTYPKPYIFWQVIPQWAYWINSGFLGLHPIIISE